MSLRSNGSYIGPRPTGPVGAYNGEASGIWDLRTAQRQQAAGAWPIAEFTPDVLSGLQLWLDASDADTLYDATSGGSLVAADGGVARWEDKSGNDRHATQGTAGARPLRKASVQNGLDGLRFDGSDDEISVASSTATFKFLHASDATVLAVCKFGNTANPDAVYGWLSTNNGTLSTNTGIFYRWDDRGSNSRNETLNSFINNGTGGEALQQTSQNGSVAANTYQQITVKSQSGESAANRLIQYANGSELTNSNGNNPTASASDSTADLTIGSVGGTQFLVGDICEIIIYNSALSDTDREAVENYLLAKWGIS